MQFLLASDCRWIASKTDNSVQTLSLTRKWPWNNVSESAAHFLLAACQSASKNWLSLSEKHVTRLADRNDLKPNSKTICSLIITPLLSSRYLNFSLTPLITARRGAIGTGLSILKEPPRRRRYYMRELKMIKKYSQVSSRRLQYWCVCSWNPNTGSWLPHQN